jgi:hypothetical protein
VVVEGRYTQAGLYGADQCGSRSRPLRRTSKRDTVRQRRVQWAREYDVDCSQCHVSVPKLNRFGGEFVANNYQWPDSLPRPRRWTIPLAIWASGRSESLPPGNVADDAVRGYINRLEVISGGRTAVPWLSYFVEWRPVSLEGRGNGTLRDRSGRFEDLYVTAQRDNLEITLGQFRQIAQIDPSRRLGLNEPLALSSALPGSDAGLTRDAKGKLSPGDARRLSLRGFAPGARSPSVRVAWIERVRDWRWTTSAALPLPGEFSIPLTREARTEASNEIEWSPKGVFVESFVRRGAASVGAHVFYDHSNRFLTDAITTGSYGRVYWTGIVGLARTQAKPTVEPVLRGRWSMEGEFIPHYLLGIGGRVENRAGDQAEPAFIPYLNAHFPGTQGTVRLTVERRFQKDRNGTFIELATIF